MTPNSDAPTTPAAIATAAGDAFWRFSLALYARPGIAEALLALQNRAGRDVNLVLYGLWLGIVHGRRLGAAELADAAGAIAPINAATVLPLREMRRRLSGCRDRDLATLRRRIAALELQGERQAQLRLAAAAVLAKPPPGDPPAAGDRLRAAAANLALYLGGEAAGAPEARLILVALGALSRRC
jgi:uncharacterized protein (TIGR02444 family)